MKLELTPVVRYWELQAKEIFATLEELHQLGACSVAAWIPWSHLETDRHHLLQKFVKQALSLQMKVSLGVTPEIGTGFVNGGIPEDLLRDRQNFAQDRSGQVIYACAPPNIHPIVSLLAPTVFQRYGHFLLKLTQELSEVFHEGFSGDVELVVSDSFFKHYQNTGLAKEDHGDYSMRHVQFSGTFKKEEWTPVLAERLFHSRAVDFLRSRFQKNKSVKVVGKNIFARDASLDRLLEEISGNKLNLKDFYEKMQTRSASCDIAWLDDFIGLTDRERNFIISSSILYYEKVWITREDYLDCSPSFRKKMDKIIHTFSANETKKNKSAVCFVQNRFAPARFSSLLQEKLGAALYMRNSIFDLQEAEKKEAKLLAVEEGFNLEFTQSQALTKIAEEQECTVVFFRSSLCEKAQREIEKYRSFRLNHGWAFEVSLFPSGGHIIVVDSRDGRAASAEAMEKLAESLLAVAKISPWCHYDRTDHQISSISVDWQMSQGMMKTLFLLNPSREAKNLSLHFVHEVSVQGLEPKAGNEAGEGKDFESSLPPLSVIPLTVFMEEHQFAETSSKVEGHEHGRKQAELA